MHSGAASALPRCIGRGSPFRADGTTHGCDNVLVSLSVIPAHKPHLICGFSSGLLKLFNPSVCSHHNPMCANCPGTTRSLIHGLLGFGGSLNMRSPETRPLAGSGVQLQKLVPSHLRQKHCMLDILQAQACHCLGMCVGILDCFWPASFRS